MYVTAKNLMYYLKLLMALRLSDQNYHKFAIKLFKSETAGKWKKAQKPKQILPIKIMWDP